MSAPQALYRFYDAAGALLYIGVSLNPGRRFQQHAGEKTWWHEVSRIEIESFPDRAAVLAAEAAAIRGERPRHNVVLNGNAPAPEVISKSPLGLKRGNVYALGLDDGTCPVGLVENADADGVTVELYSWMTGFFGAGELWIYNGSIVRYRAAESWTDERGRVFEMDPLGDFQTRWQERHGQ